MSELVGKTLGQYYIVEQIGEGGMATIYKAYQATLDRYVAVKVLTGANAADPEFREHFVREAKAVAQLNHTNILPVYDFGEDVELDVVYFVTPIVEGGSLTDRMRQPIPLAEAIRIVTEVAGALDHAHSRGIIHRDVKPDNILLTGDGHALLTDFGVAQVMRDVAGGGLQAGTPEYMAPEQVRGDTLDPRADVYALGVMLYQLLTGHAPFEDQDPLKVLYLQVHEAPVPPTKRVSGVPFALEQVVMRALEKKPAARWPTAAAMARALEVSQQRGGYAAGQTTVPAVEGPKKITREWDAVAVKAAVDKIPLRARVRAMTGFTGRAIKWTLVTLLRVVAVLLVLALVLTVGGVTIGAYYGATEFEKATAGVDWQLSGVQPPADMMTPKSVLDDMLKANLRQVPVQLEINDGWVELRPPDKFQIVVIQSKWLHTLSGQVAIEGGAPQVHLQDVDGIPLVIVGDVLSGGINRGLRASWSRQPVQVGAWNMTNDRVETQLVASTQIQVDPTQVAEVFARTATAMAGSEGGADVTQVTPAEAVVTRKPTSTLQSSPSPTATPTPMPTNRPTTPASPGTPRSTPYLPGAPTSTSGPEGRAVKLLDPPPDALKSNPVIAFRWSGGALQGGEYFVVEIVPDQVNKAGCTGDYGSGGIQSSGPLTGHEWTTNINIWRGAGFFLPCPGRIGWRVHIKDAQGVNVQSTPLGFFTWNQLISETATPKPAATIDPRKIVPTFPLPGTTVQKGEITFRWTGGALNAEEYYMVEVIPDQVNKGGCTPDYNPSNGRQWSGPLGVQEWSLNLAASRPAGLFEPCAGIIRWIVRTYNAAGTVVNTMPTASFKWNPL